MQQKSPLIFVMISIFVFGVAQANQEKNIKMEMGSPIPLSAPSGKAINPLPSLSFLVISQEFSFF